MWARINIGVAPLRAEPSGRSEMVSQAILGTAVQKLKAQGKWTWCQTPDGYQGWIEQQNMIDLAGPPVDNHPKAVRDLWNFVRAEPDPQADALVEVVRGVKLDITAENEMWTQVLLPDKRTGYLPTSAFKRITQPTLAQQIVADARDCLGISYLWGGTTTRGFDCSGLVQAVFAWNGIDLPRDSYQQVECGQRVVPKPAYSNIQPGDLLFFGPDEGRINHLAISTGQDHFIHAGCCVETSMLSKRPDLLVRAIKRLI